MPPKVSFVEPDCSCHSHSHSHSSSSSSSHSHSSDPPPPACTPTSCHRHHPPSIDEIVPGLFLGNLTAAESPETLAKHAITHVLSVTSSRPLIPPGYVHKYHSLHDDHTADLLAVLPDCVSRLEHLLPTAADGADTDSRKEQAAVKVKEKRVLVHCCMGRSRSGAVVVAYVMKTRQCSVDEALGFVVSRRGVVRPNSSFVRQLRAWGGGGFSPWVREELVVRPRVVGRAGSRRRRSVFEEEWVVVGEVGDECWGVNGGRGCGWEGWEGWEGGVVGGVARGVARGVLVAGGVGV
ncbi:protein-tyrosine phosphatase-like protein [Morchella snyderi]|nr:protein-tyrosine phosphatase-like protein [Morchella snyderi]